MRYDTNKDGFVDRAEWTAGQEARFKQLDTDKDGKLSQDELFARTPAPPAKRPAERPPGSSGQSAFFQRLDGDKDGIVSKAEFMAQAERNFARCDTQQGRPHRHRRMPPGAAAQARQTARACER